MEATLRTYVEGPKWSSLKNFIFELAQNTNTLLTIENTTKSLLSERIFFCVKGEAKNVEIFKMKLEKTIKEYNQT